MAPHSKALTYCHSFFYGSHKESIETKLNFVYGTNKVQKHVEEHFIRFHWNVKWNIAGANKWAILKFDSQMGAL